MTTNYLIKCVKTGKRVGDFLYMAYGQDPFRETNYGSANCENCGKAIMWQFYFKDSESDGVVVLGSECAKNVPKFTHAYNQFPLFKKKVELLARLQGKKLKDLRNAPIVSTSDFSAMTQLKSVDSEIAEIKAQEKAQKESQRMAQKETADLFEKFAPHNSFINSLFQQWKNGSVLTKNQIAIGHKVCADISPSIEKKIEVSRILSEQSEKVRKFVKSHNNGFSGNSHTWYDFGVSMDRITTGIMVSFYDQLREGKLLTEKQIIFVEKSLHRYRKQLEEKSNPFVDKEIQFVETIGGN